MAYKKEVNNMDNNSPPLHKLVALRHYKREMERHPKQSIEYETNKLAYLTIIHVLEIRKYNIPFGFREYAREIE